MSKLNRINFPETKPTQQEENDLFLATGFRFLPASERGFPYPWCAKKSKKGWIIRDYPPAPMQHTDTGVEFLGWRVAEKMYRGREMLLERVRIRVDQEHRRSTTKGTIESGRSGRDGATKRRAAKQLYYADYMAGRIAVSHWFRHTQEASRNQRNQANDEEFQSFLRIKKKELILRLKKKQQNTTQDEQEGTGRVVDSHQIMCQLEGSASASANKFPNAGHHPMSPLRRKHKKMIPKRNQQFSNSIILGEDPELDQMIEDIVFEFTNDCTHLNGHASGVEFDGSAVSALREAAKDTLNTMANYHVDNSRIITKRTNFTEFVSESSSENYNATADGTTSLRVYHQTNGEEVMSKHVSVMIKELIGEIEQDSGCHFDGRALETLQEVVKEIVTRDMPE